MATKNYFSAAEPVPFFVQLKDFPNYVVGENGAVYSLVHHKGRYGHTCPQFRLIKNHNAKGYRTLSLYKDRIKYVITVHTLVASAFIGPRPESLVINHKDGNKSNNHYTNLEYTTQKQNMKHAFDNNLVTIKRGSLSHRSKLSEQEAQEILNYKFTEFNQKQVAEKYSCDPSLVGLIWKRSIWTHLITPAAPDRLPQKRNKTIKLSDDDLRQLYDLRWTMPQKQAAQRFNVGISVVSQVWNNKYGRRINA